MNTSRSARQIRPPDAATDVEIEGTDAERERLARLPPQAFLPENRDELQMTVDNIVQHSWQSGGEGALRQKLWETINKREQFLAKLPTGTQARRSKTQCVLRWLIRRS